MNTEIETYKNKCIAVGAIADLILNCKATVGYRSDGSVVIKSIGRDNSKWDLLLSALGKPISKGDSSLNNDDFKKINDNSKDQVKKIFENKNVKVFKVNDDNDDSHEEDVDWGNKDSVLKYFNKKFGKKKCNKECIDDDDALATALLWMLDLDSDI